MDLIDRQYCKYGDCSTNLGVILLHIENEKDKEAITRWVEDKVMFLRNHILSLECEVMKSVNKVKLLRNLSSENKLLILRKLVPNATSTDFLSTVLMYA